MDMDDDQIRCEEEQERLRKALRWYRSVVKDCDRKGYAGDEARARLAKDAGAKARKALSRG